MPGDFALYPDASRVGMIVAQSMTGKLLGRHSSYSANNVVLTEFAASGITAVGSESLYLDDLSRLV